MSRQKEKYRVEFVPRGSHVVIREYVLAISEQEAIEKVLKWLDDQGVRAQELNTEDPNLDLDISAHRVVEDNTAT